jgi:rhodanese-related sulfurtransferase
MNKLSYLLIILALPLVFSSCNNMDKAVYESAENMVAKHQENVKFITVSDLNDLIDSPTNGLKVVDVREPDEFTAGHIPSAINVPRGLLEFSSQLTNRREKLVVYSNQQNRSTLAYDNLKLLKFRNVLVVEGGLEQWQEAYPNKVEEGSGSEADNAPAPKAASGGCGD